MNNPVVYSERVASRVLSKLQQKAYVNDEAFARWWVENCQLSKGVSRRKLTAELTRLAQHMRKVVTDIKDKYTGVSDA